LYKIVKDRLTLKKEISEYKQKGYSIGFVPTMGALHQGHLSLVEKSASENDKTVVSIFVNPTQFNDEEDFKRYPKIPEKDLEMLQKIQCDLVFLPDVNDIYPDGNKIISINLDGLDKMLEGKMRPGHFDGVVTIVKLLFDAVSPDKAYFGQKDFQQYLVVRKMTEFFNLPIQIISCPVIREIDGLAMSSRNILLNEEGREYAPKIYSSLKTAQEMLKYYPIDEIKQKCIDILSCSPFVNIDYFEIVDALDLSYVKNVFNHKEVVICTAVFVGKIRLIDNILVKI